MRGRPWCRRCRRRGPPSPRSACGRPGARVPGRPRPCSAPSRGRHRVSPDRGCPAGRSSTGGQAPPTRPRGRERCSARRWRPVPRGRGRRRDRRTASPTRKAEEGRGPQPVAVRVDAHRVDEALQLQRPADLAGLRRPVVAPVDRARIRDRARGLEKQLQSRGGRQAASDRGAGEVEVEPRPVDTGVGAGAAVAASASSPFADSVSATGAAAARSVAEIMTHVARAAVGWNPPSTSQNSVTVSSRTQQCCCCSLPNRAYCGPGSSALRVPARQATVAS